RVFGECSMLGCLLPYLLGGRYWRGRGRVSGVCLVLLGRSGHILVSPFVGLRLNCIPFRNEVLKLAAQGVHRLFRIYRLSRSGIWQEQCHSHPNQKYAGTVFHEDSFCWSKPKLPAVLFAFPHFLRRSRHSRPPRGCSRPATPTALILRAAFPQRG